MRYEVQTMSCVSCGYAAMLNEAIKMADDFKSRFKQDYRVVECKDVYVTSTIGEVLNVK